MGVPKSLSWRKQRRQEGEREGGRSKQEGDKAGRPAYVLPEAEVFITSWLKLWLTDTVLLRLKAETHLRTNLSVQERVTVCSMTMHEGGKTVGLSSRPSTVTQASMGVWTK